MELLILAVAGFVFFKSRSLVSLFKKSDAASAVQKLLEHQARYGLFEGDPSASATKYVQDVWDERPKVFNGNFGQRPHKLSVVIYALAVAAQKLCRSNDSNESAVLLALGNAISEAQVNGHLYPLMQVDMALIQEGADIFATLGNEIVLPHGM